MLFSLFLCFRLLLTAALMNYLKMILRTAKNSALSIGAESIAAEAAALEESLKADDAPAAFQYVNFRLKSFVQLSSAASVIVKTGRNAVDW